MNIKERLIEFDVIKGIAIIFVVCGHLIQCNLVDSVDRNPFYNWIYSFHMSLFFFVSGYLVDYTFGGKSVMKGLLKKVQTLLIPYIIWCFVIAPFVLKSNLPSLNIFFDYSSRYWFVYHLFVYMLFYYAGQAIKHGKIGSWGGVIMTAVILALGQCLHPCKIFDRGLQFLPIYAFGVLSSAYQLKDKTHLYREPFLSLSLTIFVVSSILYLNLHPVILNKVAKLSASFSVSYLALYMINTHLITGDNCIARTLVYVGKNSIVIYLTHFFFLQIMPMQLTERFWPMPFWAFFGSLLLSSVVIVICLVIGRIVENFHLLNRLIYGRWK